MGIAETKAGVYSIARAEGVALPLVFDSPHSGRDYPADFKTACAPALLTAAEDNLVDRLFDAVPRYGGTLLCALFPRTYIDVNRAATDIDANLLDDAWPGIVRPTSRSHAGIGLIRRLLRPGVPLYTGRLGVADLQRRIAAYYEPYHAALNALLDEAHYNFGHAWHIDCHSMPAQSCPRADFVLGDRDGTSCERALTYALRDALQRRGYRVAVNDPYKGVELVRRHGRPLQRRHSLQLEVSKALYWDERNQCESAGYDGLKTEIEGVIAFIAGYVQAQSVPMAAD